jgi:hypothetical protein
MFLVGTRVNAREHAGVIVDINFSSAVAPFEVKLDGWKETRWFYADELTLVEGSLPHSDSGDECQCAVCQTDPVPPPAKEELPIRPSQLIDWTKPIQYKPAKHPWLEAFFVGYIPNGNCAISWVEGACTRLYECKPDGTGVGGDVKVRNTPPKPRTCEAWVNVYHNPGMNNLFFGSIIMRDTSEDEARLHGQQNHNYVDSMKITYTEKL